jgi:signal transduction histidine kinase
VAWQTFETGEFRVFDDVSDTDEVYDPDTPIKSELHLPLGEHGVLIVGETTPEAFDQTDVTLAKLLAANVETALDRAVDERELRERERELRQQNEQLEKFASVLSHDLRNPLNVAIGRLEFIEGEEHEEHLEAIRRAHERMDALIEDVLTLARQGQNVGETTVIPVQRTVTQAWTQVDTGTATIDADIDLEIEADESRLQQLFENLFRNAIEHGGDNVTVRVDTLADGTGFYVADDGLGIPSDEREKIFEHGYSTASEGTGFGLAIVHQIVRAHSWTISVAESTDGGVRFEIRNIRGD